MEPIPGSSTSPDEEGIKTYRIRHGPYHSRSSTSPDEEGIKTLMKEDIYGPRNVRAPALTKKGLRRKTGALGQGATVRAPALTKKGLRPPLSSSGLPVSVRAPALTKKGLRRQRGAIFDTDRGSSTSPDEEGIKTDLRVERGHRWRSSTSPDEEGIKTTRASRWPAAAGVRAPALTKKGLRRPAVGATRASRWVRAPALTKKGLRRWSPASPRARARFEHQP